MSKGDIWHDRAAIDAFFDSEEVGHLTTISEEGWPNTVPVNFVWHAGNIFFHTGRNTAKLANLRKNPKVCFTVTEPLGVLTGEITSSACQDTQLGRLVSVDGLAREVDDVVAKLLILKKLIAKYDPSWSADKQNEDASSETLIERPGFAACVVVEIETRNLSARQCLLQNKPEKYRAAVASYFQNKSREGSRRERDLKTAVLLGLPVESR